MNMLQLKKHIAPTCISKVVTPKNLDYSGIRLICGPETMFIDYCIYVGSLTGIPYEAYQNKLIGLLTTEDLQAMRVQIDCIQLTDSTNMLALYEELRDLWNNSSIGKIVSILGTIFKSTNLDHIINQTSWIMDNPVFLVDYNSKLLAYCAEQPIDDPDMRYLIEHGHMSAQYVKETRNKDIYNRLLKSPTPIMLEADGVELTHRRINSIIWVNQKSQAMISVLEYNRKLTLADSNILGNICGILSQRIESRSYHDRQTNIISIMYESRLNALISEDSYDLSWVPGWLTYMRWEKYQVFHAAVVHTDDKLRNSAQVLEIKSKLQKSIPGRHVFLHENGIVIILNVKDATSFREMVEALKEVLASYGLSAGISKRFTHIRELAEHCRQAEDAIRIAKLLGQPCVISSFDMQMPYALLLSAQTQSALSRYDDYRLHVLRDYDKRFGADYYLTLYTYLQCACNRTQAAQRLHINRNTMDYRMNKIREILELGESDGDECTNLYLSFKAHELREAGLIR